MLTTRIFPRSEVSNINKLPRLMVAGTHSGVGKTTVTAALIAGWRQQGYRVAAFKAGPDYIDPTHLSHASGQRARNLDSYLLPDDVLRAVFVRAARQADVSVTEGVMGLFDGKDPLSNAASSADLAQKLATPVILVLDVSGTARSAAAMALGYTQFAPDVPIAGVILNRVGSHRHAELCAQALEQQHIRYFGYLSRNDDLHISSRHLGLTLAGEHRLDVPALELAARTLDLEGLFEVAQQVSALPEPAVLPVPVGKSVVRIAIAQDDAFNFYYPDALETLTALGASLIPFSPLSDTCVPDADALLIGGGYPELFAARLSANLSMRMSVQAFAASGRPVVAECGGLMYLAESLTDTHGQMHSMSAVIPLQTRMLDRPVLGYRDVIAQTDSPLLTKNQRTRGHEFHYSCLVCPSPHPAYQRTEGHETEGYAKDNVLASYIHLHYAATPEVAQRFITQALEFKGRRFA